jgi:hypothetical protein
MIFWRLSVLEANCKDFCELLDTKRRNRHSNTLQEAVGIFSVSWFNPLQNTLVRLVQGIG